MPMPTAADASKSWAAGMASSTDKIKRGIMAVTESPTEKAANAVDRQVQGVIRAAQSGKTAGSLRRVSLQEWKDAAIQKGLNRIGAGATQAQGKFTNFMSQFLPFLQQGVQSLPPRGDLEANINRATQMMRHNAGFRAAG